MAQERHQSTDVAMAPSKFKRFEPVNVDPVIRSAASTFRFFHNFNWGVRSYRSRAQETRLRNDSQVVASLTEVAPDGTPFIGNARMQVYNCSPRQVLIAGQVNSEIQIWGEIFWDADFDLHVRLNVIVAN